MYSFCQITFCVLSAFELAVEDNSNTGHECSEIILFLKSGTRGLSNQHPQGCLQHSANPANTATRSPAYSLSFSLFNLSLSMLSRGYTGVAGTDGLHQNILLIIPSSVTFLLFYWESIKKNFYRRAMKTFFLI